MYQSLCIVPSFISWQINIKKQPLFRPEENDVVRQWQYVIHRDLLAHTLL